jgi:hypothetical protein
MLMCTVKFCGGCNPRYDRGEAYRSICDAVRGIASFSLPKEDTRYDVLLIIRGCTACPYLYEEISAAHRIFCVSEDQIPSAVDAIRALA